MHTFEYTTYQDVIHTHVIIAYSLHDALDYLNKRHIRVWEIWQVSDD